MSGHRRWGISALVSSGILISYFDRISLSVAAPQIADTFHFGADAKGLLFSAFFWSYAICQLPAGMLVDRAGTVRVGRWGSLLWAMASIACALAPGYFGIMAARVFLGIAEAPSFSTSSKITGYWFPRSERALATAMYDSAAKFANVIGVPLVAVLIVQWGWRWGFAIVGLINLAYFVTFVLVYRDPSSDKGLSASERELIVSGGAAPEGRSEESAPAVLKELIRRKEIWGLTFGFGAYGYVFYFFLTWLPGYLEHTMHMSILGSAGYTAIPWAVATASDLIVGGWLIDSLIRHGYRAARVRKMFLVIGMLLGLAVIGAATTERAWVAITCISISIGGLSVAAPVFWSMPSLLAPRGAVGTLGGMMNFANTGMGGLAPAVTGFAVAATASFTSAFVVAGAVLAGGILSVLLLIDEV